MVHIQTRKVVVSADSASGGDANGSSLLPMLVVGLVLIVIGAIGVMLIV